MTEERSLEGWAPQAGRDGSLAEIVERAFDYRGNVTVVRHDGSRLEGFVFNRNAGGPRPFLQLFDLEGQGPITLLYAEVRGIVFSGKDTAAGKSYAAWLQRRDAERAGRGDPVGIVSPAS